MRNIIILLIILNAQYLFAQQSSPDQHEYESDNTIVFESPRPLLTVDQRQQQLDHAWGGDLMLSISGFGFGMFYQKHFNEDLSGFFHTYISGARNTDEFENVWDPERNQWRIANKVNRLYMMPFMIGLKRYFFKEALHESLRPFVKVGVGGAMILSTPYDREWFDAFNYADFYVRPGAFIGVGANFGGNSESLFGVNIRYYYIPFGGDGLESLKGSPLKDFGGVVLSLTIGKHY